MCSICGGKGEIQLLTSVVPCDCQLGAAPPEFKLSGPRTGRMSCLEPNVCSLPKAAYEEQPTPELVSSFTVRALDDKRDLFEVTLHGTYGRHAKINTTGPFLRKYQTEEMSSAGVYFDKALELLADYYADRMAETGMTRKECKTEGFMSAYGTGPTRLKEYLNRGNESWAEIQRRGPLSGHFNCRNGEIRSDRQLAAVVTGPREATLTVELFVTGQGAVMDQEFNDKLLALLKEYGLSATRLDLEYRR